VASGIEMGPVQIDTSTDTSDYVATDSNGLSATAAAP